MPSNQRCPVCGSYQLFRLEEDDRLLISPWNNKAAYFCRNCNNFIEKAERDIAYEKDIDQRLHDSICFLNVMISLAEDRTSKEIEIPAKSMTILRDLLKDCKQAVK